MTSGDKSYGSCMDSHVEMYIHKLDRQNTFRSFNSIFKSYVPHLWDKHCQIQIGVQFCICTHSLRLHRKRSTSRRLSIVQVLVISRVISVNNSRISDKIEVYEQPVPRTKELIHCAFKFEADNFATYPVTYISYFCKYVQGERF